MTKINKDDFKAIIKEHVKPIGIPLKSVIKNNEVFDIRLNEAKDMIDVYSEDGAYLTQATKYLSPEVFEALLSMIKPTYKESLQFEYKDCTVDVYQIEDSETYSIELFPVDQSQESFEDKGYSGFFNVKHLVEEKYSGYEFYGIIDQYPENITSDDVKAILDTVIKDIKN